MTCLLVTCLSVHWCPVCLSICLYVCSATDIFCAAQEQEGVIASDSVQDVVLEDCHARALRFACPQMTHLSLKLTKVASFTLLSCSSLQSLDLQCELTILYQHTSITPSLVPVMTWIVPEPTPVKVLDVDAMKCYNVLGRGLTKAMLQSAAFVLH